MEISGSQRVKAVTAFHLYRGEFVRLVVSAVSDLPGLVAAPTPRRTRGIDAARVEIPSSQHAETVAPHYLGGIRLPSQLVAPVAQLSGTIGISPAKGFAWAVELAVVIAAGHELP